MGGVLQIFFSAGEASLASTAGSGVLQGGEGGGAAWCRAFVAGVEGVQFYGGAKAGMRTVLDAIVPAAEVLRKKGPSGGRFFLLRVCRMGDGSRSSSRGDRKPTSSHAALTSILLLQILIVDIKASRVAASDDGHVGFRRPIFAL